MPISPNVRAWKVHRQEGRALEVEVVYLHSPSGGGEAVVRYLLTFVLNGKRLKTVGKQFFDERGMLVSDSLSFAVSKEIFNPMVRIARAILVERRTR